MTTAASRTRNDLVTQWKHLSRAMDGLSPMSDAYGQLSAVRDAVHAQIDAIDAATSALYATPRAAA